MKLFSNFEKIVFSAGLLSVVMAGCLEFNSQVVTLPYTNSFDTDDQGWMVSITPTNSIPYHTTTGGNRDGYIYAPDKFTTFWYFIASKNFVSEVKKGYGKTLYFDLKQSAIDSQLDGDDVILTAGTDVLTFDTANNPSTTWTSYSIRLNELSGWKKGSSKATKTDIQSILENLTDLRIRGEFRTGADTCGLDNAAIY